MGTTPTGSGIDSVPKILSFRAGDSGSITPSTSVGRRVYLWLDCAAVPGRVSSFLYAFGQPLDPAGPSDSIDAASCSPARPGSRNPRQLLPCAGANPFK